MKSVCQWIQSNPKLVWLTYQKMYLDVCCVFWPAFGCCVHPKAGWLLFSAVFSHFQPFLFIFNIFQWFHAWNQQKISENEQIFFLIFVYYSKLVEMQKLVEIIFFGWFFIYHINSPDKHILQVSYWKRFKMNKNGWKRLKKVVQPDFGCAKYTTDVIIQRSPFHWVIISIVQLE